MGGSVAFVATGLLDGLVGTGAFVAHPLTLLLAAAVGCALGAWTAPRSAAVGVLAAAATFTFSNQRHFPGEYGVVDDLVFSLLVMGAPALLGAFLVARVAQVRELTALSRRLDDQRAEVVAAARLEEQHRIELAVHRRLVEMMGAIALRAQGALREGDDGQHGTALRSTDLRSTALRSTALHEIEETARSGLQELRAALGVLREESAGPDGPAGRPADDPAARFLARQQRERSAPAERSARIDVALVAALGTAMVVEALVRADAPGPAWADALALLVVVSPLLLRRRRPVLAAALVSALAAVATAMHLPMAGGMVTGIGLLLVTAYSVGAWATGRRLVAGAVVVWLGIALIGLATPSQARDEAGLLPSLVWASLALGAGALAASWTRRAQRMQELVSDLELLRDTDVRVAVARQRAETARDLHDSVAHTLTVVCISAGAAAQSADLAGEDALTTIAEVARAGMDELRRGLRPLETPDLLAAPLLHDAAARLGVDLHLELPADHVWAADDATLVHRLLRETIVNAARHAPGAHVRASVALAGREIDIEIVDDGVAPSLEDPPATALGSGTGLSGLAVLVQERGGSMEFGRHGPGFRVAATVPRSTASVPA